MQREPSFRKLEDAPIRVLAVDDEPQIGAFITEYLTSLGYEVYYTDSGTSAIQFVKRIRPHIVLLDFRMDGIDGLTTLERIKAVDPTVNVIMVTAMQDEEVGRQALKLGAVDFISKPLDFKYLELTLKLKVSAMLE